MQVPVAPATAPPGGLKAEVVSTGVALTWDQLEVEDIEEPIASLYRVWRRGVGGSGRDVKVCEMAISVDPSGCIDKSMEWEKSYEYYMTVGTVVTQRHMEFDGESGAAVTVVVHDGFAPAVPGGVQAVAAGAGLKTFVDLTWVPDTDADLAGYNVYRREAVGGVTKLNDGVVAVPSYRDAQVAAGKKYFYAVTAVDLRGNESAKSDEGSESVP